MNENYPIVAAMPFDEYLSIDALTRRDIVECLRSPAHFANQPPRVETRAMRFGSLVHDAMEMGGDMFRAHYLGASGGEGIVDFPVLETLTAGEVEEVLSCSNAIVNDKLYAYFASGEVLRELTLLWVEGGMLCKARVDALTPHCEIDYKTCGDARRFAFLRDVRKYRYDIQHAWYLRGLRACGLGYRRPISACVENKGFPGVQVYEFGQAIMAELDELISNVVAQIGDCRETGEYPTYSDMNDLQLITEL